MIFNNSNMQMIVKKNNNKRLNIKYFFKSNKKIKKLNCKKK